MWSTLLYFVLYHVKSGELYGGIGTFLEDAGLILPIGTMELTWPAFRADAIAATIKVRIRRFLHQDFKRLCTIFRVHRINLHFCKKISPGIVLLCAVQYRGYPVGYFVLMLRPPFSSAVAAHRSHTACFHFAREVGQNQRNTSVFKAFWPCSYYNLIVYSTDYDIKQQYGRRAGRWSIMRIQE